MLLHLANIVTCSLSAISPSLLFVTLFLLLVLISVSSLTAGGVAELAGKFHISKAQYGLCKVGGVETGRARIAMIIWVSGRQDHGDKLTSECHVYGNIHTSTGCKSIAHAF